VSTDTRIVLREDMKNEEGFVTRWHNLIEMTIDDGDDLKNCYLLYNKWLILPHLSTGAVQS
jgi:hypothetical protein